MPVSESQTVIIPGMQMQLRSSGDLRALWHRVVATPKTAELGRYSAVSFIQFKDTPKYDKIGKDVCRRSGRFQLRPTLLRIFEDVQVNSTDTGTHAYRCFSNLNFICDLVSNLKSSKFAVID